MAAGLATAAFRFSMDRDRTLFDPPYTERTTYVDSTGRETPTSPTDICRNRHGGNPESEAANRDTTPHKERDREAIFRYLHSCGMVGATCEHLEMVLKMRHQTCSARVADLKRDGRIVATKRRRKTSSGSTAAVLVAKEFFLDTSA